MKKRLALTCALALIALPAIVSAQKVRTDFDPSVDFSAFKTFAWTDGTPSPNPFGEQRIHQIVEAALVAKGLTRVDAHPDLLVATHVVTQERKELTTYGYGGSWRWGGGTATTTVDTYTEGTLAVDLVNATTKQLVWRGVGTDTASDKAEKNTKKVQKAVDKMFTNYPPGKK
jgi:hypothetical protein